MKLHKKISEGLSGWLMFEHHSHRADLLSEKYLTQGIGNILAGNFRDKIIAEYNHPILRRSVQGRPAQIDFVKLNEKSEIQMALESKWVGTRTSTNPSIEDVLWDIIRLELLSYEYNAESIFLIAGKKSQIDKFFDQPKFVEIAANGKKNPLLTTSSGQSVLEIAHASDERKKLLMKKWDKHSSVPMPKRINIGAIQRFPENCRNFDNQVCTWLITSYRDEDRYFYPTTEGDKTEPNKK